jgi:DNA-binding FadR family transcriptional regulator
MGRLIDERPVNSVIAVSGSQQLLSTAVDFWADSTQNCQLNSLTKSHMEMQAMPNDSAATVLSLFENNIANGIWAPGTKLPTERELEKKFGVPRNRLRIILKRLELDGKINRHVGRGSFVSGVTPELSGERREGRSHLKILGASRSTRESLGDISSLTERIQGASPNDIMEVRLMVEPAAAELAALRATSADLAIIDQCNEASKTAEALQDFEYWDGRLHLEIVKAAKNELLSGLYEAINSARLQPEWEKMKQRSVTPTRKQSYRDHHSELVTALFDRDAKQARAISIEHLNVIRRSFFGE